MLNQLCNKSLFKEVSIESNLIFFMKQFLQKIFHLFFKISTQIFYVFVALLTYLLVGINRSYLSFLFHQLELPDSLIKVDEEDKSWIGRYFFQVINKLHNEFIKGVQN